MKNIIKRGTSLLLVLAMLLSFAAVVGAENPATMSEKILTFTVENKVLHAGEEAYLAVYEEVAGDYEVAALAISAISNNDKVQVKGVYPWILDHYDETKNRWHWDKTIETVFSNRMGAVGISVPKAEYAVLTWASNEEPFTTSTKPLCFVKVEATADVTPGAYQINICKNLTGEKDFVFGILDEEGKAVSKYEADTIFNPGTAVVFPEGASETVFLTQDTFAAPTWENRVSGGVYDLADYLKIAKAGTGGSVSIYPVDKNSLSITGNAPKGATLENNVLAVGTGVTNGDDATLTVVAAQGGGISLSAPVTVKVKVSKEVPYRKYIGFGNNKTYGPAPTTTQTIEAEAYDVRPQSKYYALDAGNPATFDQYGVEMIEKAKLEVVLYSDDTFKTQLSNTNEAYNYVTPGDTKLKISNQLKKDVWCTVRPYVQAESGRIYGGDADIAKVHIVSQYPQAKKAVISLTDGSGNLFSGDNAKGTFDIPGGSGKTTIKFAVDKFLDKNGGEMTSATAPMGYTVSAVAPSVEGVTVDNTNKTIEVTSEAVKSAPVEITIKVTLADNTELTGILKVDTEELLPAKITLKKGNPFATSLASYDSTSKSYVNDEIRADSHEGNALPTVLPGIGGDEASVVLAPLYVLDQYDAVMQTVAAANYKLYKVDGETKTPISADYAKFEDGTEDRVTLKLTNALAGEEGAKSLALTAGNYQIEATYNNKTATARFTMTEAAEKTYVATVTAEITAGYTGDKSVKTLPVPYAHGGTSQQRQTPEITYTATVTDQYGKAPAEGTNVVAAITSIKLGTSQADYINDGSSKFYVTNGTTNAARLQVTSNLADAMSWDAANSVVVHVGLTVTVGGTPATVESVPDYTFTTDEPKLGSLGVYLRTDESVLTALGSWNSNATNNPEALTIVAPAGDGTTRNVLDFAVYDQYRRSNGFAKALTKAWLVKGDLPTGMTFGDNSLTAGSIYEVTVTKDAVGKTFTITAPAAKNVAGTDWTVKVTAVAVEFVNGAGSDATRYELSDYLNRTANEDGTFSAEYNGQLWSAILTKKDGAKVYIKTAEGNNTLIDDNKLSLEVTKDGTPVGMDAKANAGSYQVKLVYTDAEGQTYTVDEKTFTINKATVTITATGITKEYDGTQNLVLPAGVTLTIEGNPADLTVDPSALQYASADASTGTIDIKLVPGETCLTGAAAANYDVSLTGLTGKITPRKIIVTPKAKTFEYGENDEITNALTTEFDYAGKNGTLPSGLTPTFNGSMVLTQNEEVKSTYNAGDYYPRQGTLAVNSNNYEISEFKTTVNGTEIKWVVSPKTVDPFDVTLQAEYGINGSELYAMLNTAKVTVDGKEVNLSTVYNVNVLDIEDAGKNKVSRTGTDAVNAGEYTVTNWTLTTPGKNYTFNKVPTLKIKVKPHVLTDADVQLSGETSAGFDGTKKTVTVTVSFKYGDRTVTPTKDTDYTITGEVEASNAGGHFLTVTAVPNGNLTGSVQKRWQIWSYEIQPGDLSFKLKNGVTFTYDATSKKLQKSDVTWDVTATDAKRKAFLEKNFTEDDFNLDCLEQTDAGDYTASASMRHNFTKSQTSGAFNMNVSWTIGKSSEKPISDQTASTKYGQPGSAEITVSDGVAKGLDTSKLSVSIVTDTDNIISGTPSVKFENGKITVNWQLQGDATTIDKSAKLRVTVAETDNYKQYTFDVDVTVTAKTPQTNFGFTTATDATVGYAEDTYTNPVQNVKTTNGVEYRSDNETVATVNSDGVVTIKDVGEATIWARAREDATYAEAMVRYKLTVVRSTLTVTASSATMTANDPVPSFAASVTGLKRGQTTAQVFQTLTASAATDGKTAGTYAVNASATLKADFVPRYTLRFVPGTLTVNPAVSVIDTVLPTIIAGNGCANGYANCTCESFYDLDASRWYHEAIDWAYNLGLMNGTTKSTFGPNAAATRAQTWTMLARIAGQDTRRSSTWYEVGQKWAVNLGITDGTNPMGSLTREQLAAMLYRYVGSPAVNGTLAFTDSANVSTWARNAMIWAVQNGILDGVGGNRLNPKGTTTRAQAAAIFMRFSKLINK